MGEGWCIKNVPDS